MSDISNRVKSGFRKAGVALGLAAMYALASCTTTEEKKTEERPALYKIDDVRKYEARPEMNDGYMGIVIWEKRF